MQKSVLQTSDLAITQQRLKMDIGKKDEKVGKISPNDKKSILIYFFTKSVSEWGKKGYKFCRNQRKNSKNEGRICFENDADAPQNGQKVDRLGVFEKRGDFWKA